MPWDSSANIIKKKKTKADFKKGLVKSINIFSKDKNSKSDNMVVDNIQIFKKNPRRKGYRKNYYKVWENRTVSQIKAGNHTKDFLG